MILSGLPLKGTEIILLFMRLHTSTAFWTLFFFYYDSYYISSKGNLPTVVDIMVPSGKPLKSSFPPGRSVMAYGEVGSITPTLSFISLLLLSFY